MKKVNIGSVFSLLGIMLAEWWIAEHLAVSHSRM